MKALRSCLALLGAGVAAAALVGPAPSASAATTDPTAPSGTRLLSTHSAQGHQIYRCSDAGTLVFDRPYAGLSGQIVHWGPGTGPGVTALPGPRWETYGTQTFSRIRGGASTAFANPDPGNNIPDLLVTVAGREGNGPLARTTHVIRRDSRGGTDGRVGGSCTPGSADVWIPYTTTYEFYVPR